ncbi:MAG: hypothetical protein JO040_08750 [Gemmatimonadetes bacterium]|nr:hypothetical protein [Gemmatimonadota bacterium]
MSIAIVVILCIFVLGPLARGASRGAFRQVAPGGSPEDRAEIARLREEVDRLGTEVMRLSEEQGFMMRLLEPGSAGKAQEQGGEGPPKPTTDIQSGDSRW